MDAVQPTNWACPHDHHQCETRNCRSFQACLGSAATATKIGQHDAEIARLKAELESTRQQRDDNYALAESWRCQVLARATERYAALADARRYQAIRSQFSAMSADIDGSHAWIWRGNPSRLRGPTLDAAIDAAMAGEPQQSP